MNEPQSGGLDASVDALSDVLDLIHLRGDSLRLVDSPDSQIVRHAASERLVHIVQQGAIDVAADDTVATLQAGDMALLATGVHHRITARADARWMSGQFLVEERAAGPLLAVLPPLIVIRGADLELEWLPLASGLLGLELGDPSAGSRAMISRLLDLVFIQALRAWSAGDSDDKHPGWLTAALDRPLGPAVRAIHRKPELPWTVDELASLSAMSRTSFAARFTQLVGEPPVRYLARVRLAQAADRLTATTDSVASVGRSVGYESEAAFSRAFVREYGVPPRDWRSAGAVRTDGQPGVSAKNLGGVVIRKRPARQ